MEKYVLFRYNKKSGKINKTMTANGKALLELWALQNTPKTNQCVIIDENYLIVYSTFGKDNFPEVSKPNLDCILIGVEHELVDELLNEEIN